VRRAALSAKLFDALLHLVEHAGAPVSRKALIEAVWPDTMGSPLSHRHTLCIGETNSRNASSFADIVHTDSMFGTMPALGSSV
jgi:hypothetical protein